MAGEAAAPRTLKTGTTGDAGGGQWEKVPRCCWEPRAPGADPDPRPFPTHCFCFPHSAESATSRLFSVSAGLTNEQNLFSLRHGNVSPKNEGYSGIIWSKPQAPRLRAVRPRDELICPRRRDTQGRPGSPWATFRCGTRMTSPVLDPWGTLPQAK